MAYAVHQNKRIVLYLGTFPSLTVMRENPCGHILKVTSFVSKENFTYNVSHERCKMPRMLTFTRIIQAYQSNLVFLPYILLFNN